MNVLLLLYNRPQLLQNQLNNLKRIGVKNVYVSIDGPRNDKDIKKQRDIINILDTFESISFVINRFDKNMGCRNGIIEGISWYFQNVNSGLIIEDDILFDANLFEFCEYHSNQNKYEVIGGYTLVQTKTSKTSLHGSVWGWWTSKATWQKFLGFQLPADFNHLMSQEILSKIPVAVIYEKMRIFKLESSNHIDTWDYRWMLFRLSEGILTLLPPHSLTLNIGFGSNAGVHLEKADFGLVDSINSLNNTWRDIEDNANSIKTFETDRFILRNGMKSYIGNIIKYRWKFISRKLEK